jgi:PAS domain S-box-containing protein
MNAKQSAGLGESEMAKSNPQLQLSELEAIYYSAPVGLCVFDTKLRYLRINERLADINGVSASHHIGRTVREIVPDLADQAEAIARKIIETGLPVLNVELTGRTPAQPNVPRTWLESWLPVKDSSGKVVGINVVAEEVTERKRVEDALRESEQKFRRLFEDDLTGDFMTTGDGIIVECNPAFLRMFRYENKADAVGESITALYPDPSERVSILDKLRATGKLENYESIRKRKDGILISVMENIVATFDQGGKLIEVKAYMYDITYRNQLEKDLRRSRDDLEVRVQERTAQLEKLNEDLRKEIESRKKLESDLRNTVQRIAQEQSRRRFVSQKLVEILERERQDMASTLHDEVGQILTTISMDLDLLKENSGHDALTVMVEKIEKVQNSITMATEHVRGLSRSLRPHILDNLGLVPSVKSILRDTEERSRIGCHLFAKDIPEQIAEQNALAIYRIVQEAVTNCLRHARAKNIFVNLTARDRFILITIEDDGIGFDSDRITEGRRENLGILIMNERAVQAGGEFRIESQVGKGTQVIAEIPIE